MDFDPNNLNPENMQDAFQEAEATMRATLTFLKVSAILVAKDDSMTNDEKFTAAVQVIREYGDQRVMESMVNK